MSLASRIRKGEGPIYAALKSTARMILHAHIPVIGLFRPFFGVLYHFHVAIRESAIFAARFLWFEPLFRSRCLSVGQRFRLEKLPYMTGHGQITVGNDVCVSGKISIAFANRTLASPELCVGDGTFIGHACAFAIGKSVLVGRNCLIAGGGSIRDNDGHPIDALRRRAGEAAPADAIRGVVIGDDVWIGTSVHILKGVRIGDRSVVAAGSVVTKDVPPDAVVAGNPARVVKNLARTLPGD
jgi:acetyltransferase-like isoleucine patch superfamily enzyme